MSEQIHRSRREDDDPEPNEPTQTTPAASVSSHDEELDELLDEIDSVLESNAEEFVRSFVQKGGQ